MKIAQNISQNKTLTKACFTLLQDAVLAARDSNEAEIQRLKVKQHSQLPKYFLRNVIIVD
jgi:hypothetical protein